MKSVLTSCLFFALLSAVASLECYHCVGDEKRCSDPPVKECAEKEDCCLNSATAIAVDKNGKSEPMFSYRKDCYPCSKGPNDTIRISTMHNMSFDKIRKTCKTDLCNKDNLVLRHRHELGENGRECPACLEMKQDGKELDQCKNNTKISCWADETICVSFVVKHKNREDAGNNMLFKGCGTPNICQRIKKDFQTFDDDLIHLECKDAPMSEPALERRRRAPRFLRSLQFMRFNN